MTTTVPLTARIGPRTTGAGDLERMTDLYVCVPTSRKRDPRMRKTGSYSADWQALTLGQLESHLEDLRAARKTPTAAFMRALRKARAAAPPEPRRGQTVLDVWVLRHDDGRGEGVSLWATREGAVGALAATCRDRWDNVDGRVAWVAEPGPGRRVMAPASGDGLSDEEAVETYFRYREGVESYSVYEETVRGVRVAV